MNRSEIEQSMTGPAVLYKVWATARPEHSDIINYRFPGLSFTGYFIENRENILTFSSWLNIEKIEVW